MLHTIKNSPNDFNLLFLADNEFLISSIDCFYLNMQTKKMESAILHLSTRTISIQPNDIKKPLIQIKLNEIQKMKMYTIDDIILINNNRKNEPTQKEPNKKSYLEKNTIMKRFSSKGNSTNIRILNNNSNNEYSKQKMNIKKKKKLSENFTHNFSKKFNDNSSLNGVNSNNNTNNNINSNNQSLNYNNTNTNNNDSNNSKVSINFKGNNHNITFSFSNLKINNLSDALNRVLKETITRVASVKLKEKMTKANVVPISPFSITPSSPIKHTKSPLNDLLHFFSENSFNFPSFHSLIKTLKVNYSPIDIKYEFLLFTSNKSTLIPRIPISIYSPILTLRTFFLSIFGETSRLQKFKEDKRYIIETIQKNIFDDTKDIQCLISKKVTEAYNELKSSIIEREIIIKLKCIRILPEGNQHGVFIISKDPKGNNQYFEFFPIINNYKRKNAIFQLSKIERVVPYRHLFKMRGINIFLYQSQRSKIFSFQSENDVSIVNDYLIKNSPNIDINFTNIPLHTEMWCKGLISNYDYLIYLNIMGSRSFNDLSQYPIFPWIITNYEDQNDFDLSERRNYRDLSKPIGALNQEKLNKFTEKYLNDKADSASNNTPFLYPIHYSSPMTIIFYLHRKLPRYQLQMQCGVFDSRALESIKDFWEYLYTEGNEVMELVPEFYNGDGDFLLNTYNIQFGKAKSKMIPDVVLPEWAKTAQNFIRINRNALESEYVSSNLNNWIDLIFGYKQRGKIAEINENLYRPNTYDDYDYESFNESKKYAEIVNITFSGQTPRQLFTSAHPKKKTIDIAKNTNSELHLDPKEVFVTFEKYKKENEEIEEKYKKMLKRKFEENEKIISESKEKEKKREKKIEDIRREMGEMEKKYKEIIEKMIESNGRLKENFEEYDSNKDKFIKEYIMGVEERNRKEIKMKYETPEKVINYIKELEEKINGYKIREKDYKQKIEEQTIEIQKAEMVNNELKMDIQKYDKKILKTKGIMGKGKKK